MVYFGLELVDQWTLESFSALLRTSSVVISFSATYFDHPKNYEGQNYFSTNHFFDKLLPDGSPCLINIMVRSRIVDFAHCRF